MGTIRDYEMRIIASGATLPIWELSVTDPDVRLPVDLTNFGVAVAFWYEGAAVHAVRTGYVYDAANGLARLELDGTESPSGGELRWQWELSYPGPANAQASHGSIWGVMTSPAFKRRILPGAP